jgi:hypothetical protein
MKKPQIVALAVGTPVVLATVIGVGIYRSSVHEQTCLSYENQAKLQIEDLIKLTKEMNSALSEISRNPFAGFVYMPMLPQWQQRANDSVKKANDWRYAYTKTCGVERATKFLETPDMALKSAQLDAYRNSVNSYKF